MLTPFLVNACMLVDACMFHLQQHAHVHPPGVHIKLHGIEHRME